MSNPSCFKTSGCGCIPKFRSAFPPCQLVLVILILIGLLAASCASTEELKDDEMERLLDEASEEYADLAKFLDEMSLREEELDEGMRDRAALRAEQLLEELPELGINLESHRSRLADKLTFIRNDIPEIYLQTIENDSRQSNRGYRIQIISTQDSRLAEEIREDFEEWINSVSAPPHARAYIVFQQPYYRVHVGDFHDRDKAMEFTEFVRLRYSEAWVVHSQIHPARVLR